MSLVSLMLNIIGENADDNGPQKGPVGMRSIFPPSAVRMWVRVMPIKEFRFLDLHELHVGDVVDLGPKSRKAGTL